MGRETFPLAIITNKVAFSHDEHLQRLSKQLYYVLCFFSQGLGFAPGSSIFVSSNCSLPTIQVLHDHPCSVVVQREIAAFVVVQLDSRL